MAGNTEPLTDERLAELDRLHETAIPLTFANAAGHIFNAYPALRQRLLDAEARLPDAERERDELMTMAARAQEVMRQMLNGLTTDDAVWAAYGNADSARAWLAARDAQQRREGAAEAYERAADMLSVFPGGADAEEMMRDAAKRMRERGE